MCTTCGCGSGEVKIEGHEATHAQEHTHADGTIHSHAHDYGHPHGHGGHRDHPGQDATAAALHSHAYGVPPARMVQIEQDILAQNNAFAAQNRAFFAGRRVLALNLVSSPGAGKTTLLVKTIELMQDRRPVVVIEGDQQTHLDADRIRATGAPAIQINTGKGCHLDAHMVGHALATLDPPERSILMIENVGNLVCPAAFDLGEAAKVLILSVTEGEDKPLKYPDMFRAASLLLINKCDLLPHVRFSVEQAMAYARRVNPAIEILQVSAASGEGLDAWIAWIEARVKG